MLRYIRAFWVALKMTLRGEKIAPSPYAPLEAWMARTAQLVTAIYAAADRAGLDKAARQKMTLRLDGRDMSMQTVLAAVEHHARQEYPYLVKNITDHSINAVYASNLNDQYRVLRLRDEPAVQDKPELKAVISQLSEHLNAVPNPQ